MQWWVCRLASDGFVHSKQIQIICPCHNHLQDTFPIAVTMSPRTPYFCSLNNHAISSIITTPTSHHGLSSTKHWLQAIIRKPRCWPWLLMLLLICFINQTRSLIFLWNAGQFQYNACYRKRKRIMPRALRFWRISFVCSFTTSRTL